jgi:hypothetical protein
MLWRNQFNLENLGFKRAQSYILVEQESIMNTSVFRRGRQFVALTIALTLLFLPWLLRSAHSAPQTTTVLASQTPPNDGRWPRVYTLSLMVIANLAAAFEADSEAVASEAGSGDGERKYASNYCKCSRGLCLTEDASAFSSI